MEVIDKIINKYYRVNKVTWNTLALSRYTRNKLEEIKWYDKTQKLYLNILNSIQWSWREYWRNWNEFWLSSESLAKKYRANAKTIRLFMKKLCDLWILERTEYYEYDIPEYKKHIEWLEYYMYYKYIVTEQWEQLMKDIDAYYKFIKTEWSYFNDKLLCWEQKKRLIEKLWKIKEKDKFWISFIVNLFWASWWEEKEYYFNNYKNKIYDKSWTKEMNVFYVFKNYFKDWNEMIKYVNDLCSKWLSKIKNMFRYYDYVPF